MRIFCIILLVSIFMLPGSAAQKKKSRVAVSRASATKIVRDAFPGARVISTELERENGTRVWSFDINDHDTTKEVWVDARTGAILKTDIESAAAEAAETASDHSRAVALKRVPGDVVNLTMKERRGRTIYSYEIRTRKGITVEVDVDSLTQKIVNMESEPPSR
jgi:uncharacterized membrane protein YkoI